MNERRVVVVGAGLTGLTVAARLLAAGREPLLLEESTRAGGQIHTHREPGVVVELGAEGFVARSRAVPELCGLLGIEASLIDQLTTDTYAFEAGELALLPPGEAARRLGFQVPEEELGRGIRSLAGGMGELTDALLVRLGARVRLGAGVQTIRAQASGIALELASGARETCDALVLATPARMAARQLAALELPAAQALLTAPLTSNVSVNLLYRAEQLARLPAGSGLLFPDELGSVGLRALSIVHHKFEGRVPEGRALLRVFFRPVAGALETWDDARFSAEASRAIDQVLGADGAAQRSWVSRWVDALPVFTPQHRAQVAELDAVLQARSIHLTGAAFHGAGIDAAVASAATVAARLSS